MEWSGSAIEPLHLFDPLAPPAQAWPKGRELERAYIEGVAQAGVLSMVSNAHTRWLALRSGDRVFPVTVNEGEQGGSYVCLPLSAYILYARRELDLVDVGRAKPFFRWLIRAADRYLKTAELNKIVHVDNWLLSTNLHGDWQGQDSKAIAQYLSQQFPDHIIAIRSIDPWSSPALYQSMRASNWQLIPSRQIWVVDEVEQAMQHRRDLKRDLVLTARSSLSCSDLKEMTDGQAQRIAQLYGMLYLTKYSDLNPVFTPAWIRLTHEKGIIRYQVARGSDGTIMAVCGTLRRGTVTTPPIVGYDLHRPAQEGLYRIACLMAMQDAAQSQSRLNCSAGAASFKRNRGAHGIIEYSAYYVAHLPTARQRKVRALRWVLDTVAVPFMRSKQL